MDRYPWIFFLNSPLSGSLYLCFFHFGPFGAVQVPLVPEKKAKGVSCGISYHALVLVEGSEPWADLPYAVSTHNPPLLETTFSSIVSPFLLPRSLVRLSDPIEPPPINATACHNTEMEAYLMVLMKTVIGN
ncbi:hypothetical protein L1987_08094 [Smallanthus sonchifolius]|uniref:Uncharacterized protein n=1 Tax=Smallanthus sonchifolius TaxID=185202 RepID=A0ACB9JLG4_9ASTR|nr:hypothetical protein L1987_08094 [Smallanthus sonchifolius]